MEISEILTYEEYTILNTLLNKIAASTLEEGLTINTFNSPSGIKIKFKRELTEQELYTLKKEYEHWVFENMSDVPSFLTAYVEGIKKGNEL